MADALGLLGLARRGGRLELGATAVEQGIRQGRAALLLLAADAGPNLVRRAERWAGETGVELSIMPCGKAEFGRAMGRTACALAILTDEGFAKAYKQRQMQL